MLDEKKSGEELQGVQAEVCKDEHSGPLTNGMNVTESDPAIVADGEDRISFFVWLLVACSSISGLLFGKFPRFRFNLYDRLHRTGPSTWSSSVPTPIGYDTGVISGALVTIGSDLGPTVLSSGQKVLFRDFTRFK